VVVTFGFGWTTAAILTGELEADTVATLATTGGILASVLVHEGAHALAARSLGYDVEWMVLGLVAGTTSYSGRDDRPLDRAAIALAGPAVSAVVVLLLFALWSARDAELQDATFALFAFNALTLVANLFPLPGSDGWHTTARLLEHWSTRTAG
jgi:Zn-dependent protease